MALTPRTTALLTAEGLEEYAPLLADAGCRCISDIATNRVTEDELIALGVTKLFSRKKLMRLSAEAAAKTCLLPTPQHESTPTPAPLAGGAYRIEVKFTNGAKYKDLRRLVYVHAEDLLAFDGKIEYAKTPITSESDLDVELFFETRQNALQFETRLRRLRDKSVTLMYNITPVQHTCIQRVFVSDYNRTISPVRAASGESLCSEPSGGTEVYTKKLTAEDVQQESVVCPTIYSRGPKPEWAHIKERTECTQAEKEDPANRLVMPAELHQLYDGRGSDESCMVSFYADPKQTMDEPPPGKRARVEITVQFADSKTAADFSPRLLPLTQFDSVKKTYTLSVYKLFPRKFIGYLNDRHAKNITMGGFPPGLASVGD